ncbi:hypothetical protein PR202_gb12388 [Eleusine coracana subsp. coracana]|uniref:poly(A)-specific ribonuclease n=1 Tax=Eleusine coracana subsp. coracana TaxID=191504 RepID=A0AAV5EPS2_ELECO|nr:hypothetical protein PR202_gb12388 [Eleusine coracana subsp. coracana]
MTTFSMPSRAPRVPAPIKTRTMTCYYDYDLATPTTRPDVVNTASWSPPSTPSSSDSTAASPPAHGAPPTAFSHHHPVPRSIPPPPSQRVAEVRQVWHENFTDEAALIDALLPKYRYAAIDTEFPGTVYRPSVPAYLLTPEKRYALLKANVDALHLIQLGLTLFNSDPTSPPPITWEFTFREFDPAHDPHAADSIALLRAAGVDFARAARHGVHASAFGPRLRRWLMRAPAAGLVTFAGGRDVAHLIKAAFGSGYRLPASAPELEAVAAAMLRRRPVFDVKEMAQRCGPRAGDLRGGLDCVAAKLGVARDVGVAHRAGADSLLTCRAFLRMKELYFDDDDKLGSVAGLLTDITTSF